MAVQETVPNIEQGIEASTNNEANYELKEQNFKRVLVALDSPTSSEVLLERALFLAKAMGSELMLFHALIDPLPNTSNVLAAGSMGIYGGAYSSEMFQQSQTLIKEEKERLIQWLQQQQQKASALNITTGFDYKEGDPGHQICHKAKQWNADLVIVGRRGRSGLSEMLLGSVSNYVLHHAHCTVMVIQ